MGEVIEGRAEVLAGKVGRALIRLWNRAGPADESKTHKATTSDICGLLDDFDEDDAAAIDLNEIYAYLLGEGFDARYAAAEGWTIWRVPDAIVHELDVARPEGPLYDLQVGRNEPWDLVDQLKASFHIGCALVDLWKAARRPDRAAGYLERAREHIDRELRREEREDDVLG